MAGEQGVEMDDVRDADFLFDMGRATIFAVAGLGGQAEASTTFCCLEGVSLHGGEPRASLVYCPAPQDPPPPEDQSPRLELMLVQRPRCSLLLLGHALASFADVHVCVPRGCMPASVTHRRKSEGGKGWGAARRIMP